MSTEKLAIFPCAGGLGTATLTHLLSASRVPASNLILISRNPSKYPVSVFSSGAELRQADYDSADTLLHAFNGAHTLLLISYPSMTHEHRTKVHKSAIDCALKSGVKHILYTSLAFAGPAESKESVVTVMQAHLDTEGYLAKLAEERDGFTYTVIREGLYSESFPIYTATFDLSSPTNTIRIPHDGSGPGIAWAKQDELGEATARICEQYHTSCHTFRWINKTNLLSGPTSLSLSETAKILEGVVENTGVRIEQVSVEEYANQERVVSFFKGDPFGDPAKWTSAFEGVRRGETDVVNGLLEELLGRAPESFEKTVHKMKGN